MANLNGITPDELHSLQGAGLVDATSAADVTGDTGSVLSAQPLLTEEARPVVKLTPKTINQMESAYTIINAEAPGFLAKVKAFFSCLGMGFTNIRENFARRCQEIDERAGTLTGLKGEAQSHIQSMATELDIKKDALVALYKVHVDTQNLQNLDIYS